MGSFVTWKDKEGIIVIGSLFLCKKTDPEDTYETLENAEVLLKEYMEEALSSPDPGIYLLKAQTALGKTTAYCKLAQEDRTTKKFMIVAPTIKLQGEICRSLQQAGVKVWMENAVW